MSNDLLLVVCLRDTLTSDVPIDPNLTVSLVGNGQRPLKKAGGVYVFTEMAEGTHTITTHSDYYLSETVDIEVKPLNPTDCEVPIVPISPGPAYPFFYDITLFVAMVKQADEQPIEDLQVQAFVMSSASSKAKLAEQAAIGATELQLNQLNGLVKAGERYFLQEVNGTDRDVCVVKKYDDENHTLTLDKPLSKAFGQGTMLRPFARSRTDARGQVLIPFGNLRAREFDVRIEFAETHVEEVRLTEGRKTSRTVIL